MKTIIFCSTPKFLWIFKKFTVYIRSSFFTNKNKNTISVKEDIFTGEDYQKCDYLSSCIEKELLNRLIPFEKSSFLFNWGGRKYHDFILGKQLIRESKRVFESFIYADKVYKNLGLTGDVYIFPDHFSLKIYNEIRRIGELPEYIKIHTFAKIYIFVYNFVKFIYFFLKILFFPEYILSKAKWIGDKYKSKEYFKSCVYLDDGLMSVKNDQDKIANNYRIFSLFKGRDVMYIDDNFNNKSLWTDLVDKEENKIFVLDDIVKHISKVRYLREFYISAFKWRFKLLTLSIVSPYLVLMCFKSVRSKILLDLFYSKYSIENAIYIMVAGELTSCAIHAKNNTNTVFIYLSTTEDISENFKEKDCATFYEYTHIMVNTVISSHISNMWLKSLDSDIGNYITIGPIFSDFVSIASNNKREIINKLSIINNTKIVSFFDHAVGYSGILSFDAYKSLLESILSLVLSNKNIFFIFKSKRSFSDLKKVIGKDSIVILENLSKESNFLYSDQVNLTTFEIMGISDLVVSSPMSSVMFESLCGGIKTVVYDPLGLYKAHNDFPKSAPNLNVTNYYELCKVIDYWLFQCTGSEFDKFSKKYVIPMVDKGYINEKSISRVQKVL